MASRVLVVGPSNESRNRTERCLRQAGFEVDVVATFEAARPRLTASGPDALVSVVQLGEFNGLHLAILGRDRRPALVTIVIGTADSVLAKDAKAHGTTYLIEPVLEEALVTILTTRLYEVGRQRHWPRRHVAETVSIECDASPGRIVDLSYGGVRLEVADSGGLAPPRGSHHRVNLPAFDVSIDVELVWTQRGPYGFLQYGAAVSRTVPAKTSAWKQVVDRVGVTIQ